VEVVFLSSSFIVWHFINFIGIFHVSGFVENVFFGVNLGKTK
jgi:hypothetical protein